MKKIAFALFASTIILTSCGGGSTEPETSTNDSTAAVTDTTCCETGATLDSTSTGDSSSVVK